MVWFGGQNSIRIPVGKTNERPKTPYMGNIRFNKNKKIFEGYQEGSEWMSLVGVQDNDQDTYITTETTLGSDEDIFTFYTNNKQSLTLNENKLQIYGQNETTSFMVENDTGDLNFTGDMYTGGNIYGIIEENKGIFQDISLSTITIGSLESKVKIGGTNCLIIPSGTLSERIHSEEGAIRYNETKKYLKVIQKEVNGP